MTSEKQSARGHMCGVRYCSPDPSTSHRPVLWPYTAYHSREMGQQLLHVPINPAASQKFHARPSSNQLIQLPSDSVVLPAGGFRRQQDVEDLGSHDVQIITRCLKLNSIAFRVSGDGKERLWFVLKQVSAQIIHPILYFAPMCHLRWPLPLGRSCPTVSVRWTPKGFEHFRDVIASEPVLLLTARMVARSIGEDIRQQWDRFQATRIE